MKRCLKLSTMAATCRYDSCVRSSTPFPASCGRARRGKAGQGRAGQGRAGQGGQPGDRSHAGRGGAHRQQRAGAGVGRRGAHQVFARQCVGSQTVVARRPFYNLAHAFLRVAVNTILDDLCGLPQPCGRVGRGLRSRDEAGQRGAGVGARAQGVGVGGGCATAISCTRAPPHHFAADHPRSPRRPALATRWLRSAPCGPARPAPAAAEAVIYLAQRCRARARDWCTTSAGARAHTAQRARSRARCAAGLPAVLGGGAARCPFPARAATVLPRAH